MNSDNATFSDPRREHPRIMRAIAEYPWAITKGGLEQIIAVVEQRGALEVKNAEIKFGQEAIIQDRVATIPVKGPLFQKANLFSQMSDASSYDLLSRDVRLADQNDDVDAIVLSINSPGGIHYGISDVYDAIQETSKPGTAYVDGQAASAAYWIASAADEIVMNRTAEVGSIGSVMKVAYGEEEGVKEFVAAQSPYKRLNVDNEENVESYQQEVDAAAQDFIDDVAKGRGVSSEHVANNYGKGAMLLSRDAERIGMVDRVSSYENAVSVARENGAANRAARIQALSINITNSEAHAMSDETNAVETAAKELSDEVKAKLKAQGESDALARINSILALSDEPQFQSMLKECAADSQCSLVDAKLKLADAKLADADERMEKTKQDAAQSIRDSITSLPADGPSASNEAGSDDEEWGDPKVQAEFKGHRKYFDAYKQGVRDNRIERLSPSLEGV